MKTLAALLSLFAISQAATLVPVDTSVVNVKSEHSGQDYSYSIHENHGVALNPTDIVHPVPVIKTVVPEVHHQVHQTVGIVHGPEHIHPENHQQAIQHEVRPQTVAKAAPIVPEHTVVVGSYPSPYLSYVPVSYQYGVPYGYNYPSNVLAYRLA